jgi:nitrous oxidase accessory protein NosD
MLAKRLTLGVAMLAAGAAILSAATQTCAQTGPRNGRYGYLPPTASQPVVLNNISGRTLRGLRIAADRSIDLRGCSDITIISCDVRSIRMVNCSNIRVVNSYIHDTARVGVELENCRNVLVQGNRIERISTGVYALQSEGVRVVGNYVQDVRGPMPRGQMVQFDKVFGSGNAVTDNYARNLHRRSKPEDCISLYQSSGTPASPILIARNYITGDPQYGSTGMSDSGSGIMLGDSGGSYIRCVNNVLINPGQVGIGVCGGEFISVENNTIIGRRSDVANVGLYVWNQADAPGGSVTVANNSVTWVNRQGKPNAFWNGGGFHSVTVDGNRWNATALLSQLPRSPSTAPWPPIPFGKNPLYPWR